MEVHPRLVQNVSLEHGDPKQTSPYIAFVLGQANLSLLRELSGANRVALHQGDSSSNAGADH